MKEIILYLKTLDKDTLHFVVQRMLGGGGVHTDVGDQCCPGNPPTNHPTQYGEWVCSGKPNCTWVWIPELG